MLPDLRRRILNVRVSEFSEPAKSRQSYDAFFRPGAIRIFDLQRILPGLRAERVNPDASFALDNAYENIDCSARFWHFIMPACHRHQPTSFAERGRRVRTLRRQAEDGDYIIVDHDVGQRLIRNAAPELRKKFHNAAVDLQTRPSAFDSDVPLAGWHRNYVRLLCC